MPPTKSEGCGGLFLYENGMRTSDDGDDDALKFVRAGIDKRWLEFQSGTGFPRSLLMWFFSLLEYGDCSLKF